MQRRNQEDRSRATKAELMRIGRELFAEHGYAKVSAEQIVAAAGVTRGALYHHFGDKRGLFVAVLEEVETETTAAISEPLADGDLMTGMMLALGRFLDACQRPEIMQITMTDAHAVLGWQGWREMEARHGLGVMTDALRRMIDAGLVRPVPIDITAQLLLSAIAEAGMIIAHADDQVKARAEAEQSLMQLIGGLLTST